MARFRMSDGMVVDTGNASKVWEEDTFFDGSNHISRATGGQWDHETLYRSRRGRYYVVSSTQWQGSVDSAEWVSKEEAARWLLTNDHEIPDDLREVADKLLD